MSVINNYLGNKPLNTLYRDWVCYVHVNHLAKRFGLKTINFNRDFTENERIRHNSQTYIKEKVFIKLLAKAPKGKELFKKIISNGYDKLREEQIDKVHTVQTERRSELNPCEQNHRKNSCQQEAKSPAFGTREEMRARREEKCTGNPSCYCPEKVCKSDRCCKWGLYPLTRLIKRIWKKLTYQN